MKALKKMVVAPILLAIMFVVTACGTEFSLTTQTLSDYAAAHSGTYEDTTAGTAGAASAASMDVNNIHVEFQELGSTEDAYKWYEDTSNQLLKKAHNSASSNSNTNGNYFFDADDGFYAVLFCNNQCVYAYGTDSSAVKALLKDIGIKY